MISANTPIFLSPITAQKRHRAMGRLRPNPKATLRQQVHEVMRFFHYSDRTEETYWQWMVRYLQFHRRVAVAVAAPQPGPLLDRGGEGDETDAVERVPTAAVSVRGSKLAVWQILLPCTPLPSRRVRSSPESNRRAA